MKEINNKENKNKKIEIIKGSSRDLEISDVKDNLTFENHENIANKNGEIVIPESKNNDKK